MSKRINIILPDETVAVLDSVAGKGERSRFIAEAVTYYVSEVGKQRLRQRVKAGALANAARDLEIAQEWFAVEEQAWRQSQPDQATPSGETSTLSPSIRQSATKSRKPGPR